MDDTAAGAPAITVRGLTKSFGNYAALRGIDLEVERGEALVIFGPNGAGKTTLIKILATIVNPSGGEILVDGLQLKRHADDIRRRIGIITHHTFLYGNLTACENLEFYGRLYDVPSLKERVREVVGLVGMSARLYDRVGTLSRGMQQRLSLARALLHRPSIMLLDEPETGLDQQAISILYRALRADGTGKPTVVLTTHSLERGLELADRLLILDRGKIVHENLTGAVDLAGLQKTYHEITGARA